MEPDGSNGGNSDGGALTDSARDGKPPPRPRFY